MKFRLLATVLLNDRPWTQRWLRKGVWARGWEIGRVKRSGAGLPGRARKQSQYNGIERGTERVGSGFQRARCMNL